MRKYKKDVNKNKVILCTKNNLNCKNLKMIWHDLMSYSFTCKLCVSNKPIDGCIYYVEGNTKSDE
jgi:hypothetical protein